MRQLFMRDVVIKTVIPPHRIDSSSAKNQKHRCNQDLNPYFSV
jgi:hypothetical protein